MNNAPDSYKNAGLFMIIAGAFNLMQGFVLVMVSLMYGLGTFGLCCPCVIPSLIPLVAGIFELMAGIRIQRGEVVPEAQTVSIVGLISAILGLAMIPMIMEILVMVQLGNAESQRYIREQGSLEG
jgi:hypothetical protein